MTMFKTYIFKDTRRSPGQKRAPVSRKQLFKFEYNETVLPYFEIMPAQLLTDPRYTRLSRQDQGDFLRLIMLMWLDRCRYVRCPAAIAHEMGMAPGEWEELEKRLLHVNLLDISPDGLYLIQPSLREQYLFNRQSNINKKRSKSAIACADVNTDASAKYLNLSLNLEPSKEMAKWGGYGDDAGLRKHAEAGTARIP